MTYYQTLFIYFFHCAPLHVLQYCFSLGCGIGYGYLHRIPVRNSVDHKHASATPVSLFFSFMLEKKRLLTICSICDFFPLAG